MFSLLANQDWAAQEQQLRIFKLQAERERLKRRQQEIAKLSVSFLLFLESHRKPFSKPPFYYSDWRGSLPARHDRSHATRKRRQWLKRLVVTYSRLSGQ